MGKTSQWARRSARPRAQLRQVSTAKLWPHLQFTAADASILVAVKVVKGIVCCLLVAIKEEQEVIRQNMVPA
jgi:hypothetical protein